MGDVLGKLICAITGRDTPEEIEQRRQADEVLKGIGKAAQGMSETAEKTRIWAEKVKKRCTERKAEKEAARKASESAAQAVVSGNGEAAHGQA